MSDKVNIQKIISEETEKRLEQMQSPDYKFPTKMGKMDYAAIILSCALSIVLVCLCMCGVIV